MPGGPRVVGRGADAGEAPNGLLGLVLNLLAQRFHVFAETLGGLAAGGGEQGKSESDEEQDRDFRGGVHGRILADRPSGCYGVNADWRGALRAVAG